MRIWVGQHEREAEMGAVYAEEESQSRAAPSYLRGLQAERVQGPSSVVLICARGMITVADQGRKLFGYRW